MNNSSAFLWWHTQRPKYSKNVTIAFYLAFVAFLFIGFLLGHRMPGFETTVFTIVIQIIGIFIALKIAHLCFFLGFVAEKLWQPKNAQTFRNRLFAIGLYFSCALPFTIPILLILRVIYGQH